MNFPDSINEEEKQLGRRGQFPTFFVRIELWKSDQDLYPVDLQAPRLRGVPH